MIAERDTTRIVRSWLEIGATALPDRVLDSVLDQLPTTPQRRAWWPARRIETMNAFAKLAIGAAALFVLALVGINLLPGGRVGVGGGPAPSPSPSPFPSPSPSPGADVWPTGTLAAGRYDAKLLGIPFSFDVPSPDWRSSRGTGILETGAFPFSGYAWVVFPDQPNPNPVISTDPCAGEARPIGASMAEQATALTTIPGTDAVGPTDVTVGGLPAKSVVLTIHDDIPCPSNQFWLYGKTSLYPNSLESTIRVWYVSVNDQVLSIHTDQAGTDPKVEREIKQIIDSIQFK